MKDPEFKKMIGNRLNNSDGFTYVYGRAKDGSPINHGMTAATKRQIRNDKRSVKQKILKRIKNDEMN